MSTPVITVRNLGKQYLLGEDAYPLGGRTLRDTAGRFLQGFAGGNKEKVRAQGAIWALKNVTLEIHDGEILGIIGRNGAGKSTLLKILSRITRPTQGAVRVVGRVASLLEVGTGFHRELTGRENIFLNGAVLGMKRSEIKACFDEIVDFAGIERFLDTPVKRYSSGMYLRLAFSVAAHLQPDILLVDEVLAVGDAEFQNKCLKKMHDVVLGGRTVLFVSHNLAAISRLCPSSILLEEGGVRTAGPTDDVIRAYLGAIDTASAVVNLEQNKQEKGNDGTRPVRLRRIELANPYVGKFAVRWREPFKLRIEIEVASEMRQAVFEVRIDGLNGGSILSTYSSDPDDRSYDLDSGRYALNLSIENHLQAGRYFLTVGGHNSISRERFLFAPHAAACDVLDIPYEAKRYIGRDVCLINGDALWSTPEKL